MRAFVHVIRPGESLTECCGKAASELPKTDRTTSVPEYLTLPADVFCNGHRPTPPEIRQSVETALKTAPKTPNPFTPRPVVDLEQMRRQIADEISPIQVGQGYESVTIGSKAAMEAAEVVVRMWPTSDEPIAVVHCGDMEQHAVSFNDGYAEAQRQGIGGPESRAWVVEKVTTVLGPLASLRPDLAGQVADQLLTETDMRSPGPVRCSNCEGDTFVCAACGVAYDANA